MDEVEKGAALYGGTITKMLMEYYNIESQEIGKSRELYYRVPCLGYDASIA